MNDRDRIEAKDNWVLTIKRLRPGVREKYDCLMESYPNAFGERSYFWYTPDYQGVFSWGATRSFMGIDDMRRCIDEGDYCIVKARPEALTQIGLRERRQNDAS